MWHRVRLPSAPLLASVGIALNIKPLPSSHPCPRYDSVVRYDRKAGLMGGWQELAPLQVRTAAAGYTHCTNAKLSMTCVERPEACCLLDMAGGAHRYQ